MLNETAFLLMVIALLPLTLLTAVLLGVSHES